jgi:hypothetical protein
VWYPTRWLGWGRWPRYAQLGRLAKHVRFLDRTTRRLSRSIFHMMVKNGPKLEKRQALLFRAVDIGAELYAMSAAVSRAHALRRAGTAEGAAAIELADVFCRQSRRRIADRFRAMRSNDDVVKYKLARRLLSGDFKLVLETGLVPVEALQELAAETGPHQPELVAAGR